MSLATFYFEHIVVVSSETFRRGSGKQAEQGANGSEFSWLSRRMDPNVTVVECLILYLKQ